MKLRPLELSDRPEYADLVYTAFNTWYWKKGWEADYFQCPPSDAGVFLDIYHDLTPGCSVAAFDEKSGRMMGACFYHPRAHHMSLGIMSVHPDFFGQGVGRKLVNEIIHIADSHSVPAIRLVGSAINMDSFSLYNRAGFVPRQAYHDMVIRVPAQGLSQPAVQGKAVRPARLGDVAGMGNLEMTVSGIRREIDYRYAIENRRGYFEALVCEGENGAIDGFMIDIRHPALNMLGPCVARDEEIAAALIARAADRFRSEAILLVIPMDKRALVEQMYRWNARNVETHLFQVRGAFQNFNGVNLPSFLPETG